MILMNKEESFVLRTNEVIFKTIFQCLMAPKIYSELFKYICIKLPRNSNDRKFIYEVDIHDNGIKEIFYKPLYSITDNDFKITIKIILLLYEYDFNNKYGIRDLIENCLNDSKEEWYNPWIYIVNWEMCTQDYENKYVINKIMFDWHWFAWENWKKLKWYQLRFAKFIFIENKWLFEFDWNKCESYVYWENSTPSNIWLSNIIRKFNQYFKKFDIKKRFTYSDSSYLILESL